MCSNKQCVAISGLKRFEWYLSVLSPETSSAFLNDDQCEATIGDEFITVSFGLDQCGTKMEFSETLLDFNNEIFLR